MPEIVCLPGTVWLLDSSGQCIVYIFMLGWILKVVSGQINDITFFLHTAFKVCLVLLFLQSISTNPALISQLVCVALLLALSSTIPHLASNT